MKGKGFLKFLKDVDDVVHIITGKRLNQHAQRAWELFGPGAKVKEEETESDDPYAVLGVRRDAADVVVKAAFRKLSKLYHPDGETPDPEKFRRVKEAYDKIEQERKG